VVSGGDDDGFTGVTFVALAEEVVVIEVDDVVAEGTEAEIEVVASLIPIIVFVVGFPGAL
jgi:hypothetical protein